MIQGFLIKNKSEQNNQQKIVYLFYLKKFESISIERPLQYNFKYF